MAKAIEVIDLVKNFGSVRALSGITLSSDEGKILGILGPNGAGKTTIIRVLSTLLMPDSGMAKVQGWNVAEQPQKIRETIGLAGQYAALDEFQTGYENIFMTGRLYGLDRTEAKKRTEALLKKLDLGNAAKRPVSTYSGGMRRRLDLGACLIGRPSVLFLDEPTTGLDPRSRLDIWNIIRELAKQGTSILLTTQYLEEADQLADKIVVIGEGKVIAEGTSSELKARLSSDIIEFRLVNSVDRLAALRAVAPFAKQAPTYDETTLQIRVPVRDGSTGLMDIVGALNDARLKVTALSLRQPSLDDVFLSLMGKIPQKEAVPQTKSRRHGNGH